MRALLIEPSREWTVRGLAGEVGVSPGYAHAVVSTLIDLGCVARTEKYRLKMINPTVLLRRWAAFHQYDRMNEFLEYYTFEAEIDRLIVKLVDVDAGKYALTALAGAYFVAPHVRPVDVHMYVHNKDDALMLAKVLRLEEIPRNGNVKFVVPYDEGVFYGKQEVEVRVLDQIFGKVSAVSDVQLYVDLFNYPSRGMEAAEHLYQKIVRDWGKGLVSDRIVR